ncbi:hypothetical protein SAMN02745133_00875 [Desulforamulus putei DSM 12395]|uniref:Uncharacterized protein n=1 Tax=Desulforamulus putei DSM 12395 TaxID=1121429 RepID=A0A1M4VBW4_9FIRM|nr:hypothetical protein SAMN02745133_00875 [Desulforamulus putei DSM 12395]
MELTCAHLIILPGLCQVLPAREDFRCFVEKFLVEKVFPVDNVDKSVNNPSNQGFFCGHQVDRAVYFVKKKKKLA